VNRRRVAYLSALAGVALVAAGCQIKTPEQLPVSLYEKPAPAGALHGRIAYVQTSGPDSSAVHVMDLAAGTNDTLPLPSGQVEDLAWSPDGKTLAFALQSGSGQSALWTSAADGSDAKQLTHETSVSVEDPAWSPDGSRLAAAAFGPSGWSLVLVDAHTGDLTPVPAAGGQQRFPAWMPDGNRLVYSGRNRAGLYKLYSVDLRSNSTQVLTRGPGDDLHPAVSSDGKILFSSTRPTISAAAASQTYLLNSDGSAHAVVSTNSVESWPTWSPDMRYVAVAAPHLGVYAASGAHLSDGSLRWKLTNLPVWSPRWTA